MIIDELFEGPQMCPECGGISFSDLILAEKKDACYHKVKASAKVWPSAYASGRLVQCRKKGAANYGNKSEGVAEGSEQPVSFREMVNVVDQHYPKYYAELSGSDISDKQFERAIVNAYKKIMQKQGMAEGWKDVVAGGALALGALGAGAQTMPNINAQQVELTNKYYNALVQRAKEDGRELDRRTLNFLKAKAEDAAALKLQQASPKKQQGFPAQGSERRVSRNIDNFESQGVAEGSDEIRTAGRGAIRIPGDMSAPHWREPTWSFQEIAQKLGIPVSALNLLAFNRIGGFPEALPGLAARYGSKKYYKQSEIKRWVNANNVREKLKQGMLEGALDDSNFGKSAASMTPTPQAAQQARDIVQQRADDNVISQAKIAGAVPITREGEQQKGADYRDPKEVDYDGEYDAMVARVKKLAGVGPMRTVYDPNKRVYRNMPTAQQPKK
jgi:hypothetical protein